MSQAIRPPAVAGTFYPAVPARLQHDVDGYLADAEARLGDAPVAPKAIIAPHAGYVYSAPVAASAYASLRAAAERIRRVVLLGPSHRVSLRGLATTSADRFDTPLGPVPIDRASCERAAALPAVCVMDGAHALEHSLEVQLPFLQRVLNDFELVPFSVGDASGEEVAEVLELLWGGPETLVVVSSDLSHYYDYETAKRLDAATTHAIEALDPGGLDAESACGRVPVRGLLLAARRHGLDVETVDVRSSGDTAGPRDQVVGYGSWLFRDQDAVLLDVARRAVASEREPEIDAADYPPALREIRATFVTLLADGELRGCIGSLVADRPLVEDVARSAYRAAHHDPRFPPVTPAEAAALEIHVSVLSPAEPMSFDSEADLLAQLRPGVDGLILEDGTMRATFLPDVWESLPEPADFLAQLKKKAGLPVDHRSGTLRVSRYTTRRVG